MVGYCVNNTNKATVYIPHYIYIYIYIYVYYTLSVYIAKRQPGNVLLVRANT